MTKYDDGQAAYAAGTALEANPYSAGEDQSDWFAGWSDAKALEEESSGESGALNADDAAETSDEVSGATEGEAVESLGDVGYGRIIELLEAPPLDDLPGYAGDSLPPGGEVPSDLSGWLEAWKQPLSFVAVDTAINAVKTRLGGAAMSRGRLKELYRGMAPEAMAAAMQANADTVAEFADQRVAEAGLIASLEVAVTQKAAGYLLTALMLV